MKCERCRELLSWYLEKEIRSEEVEEHLSACEKCSKDFRMLEEILTQVRILPKVTPPYQTCLQIIEKIKALPLPGEVIYKCQTQEGGVQKTFIFKRKKQPFAVNGISYKFESRTFRGLNGTKKEIH